MDKKKGRYERIFQQLRELLKATDNRVARMATVTALLHHKMDGFFWTGFYLLGDGELVVGPYQGPLACQILPRDTGVCWAGLNEQQTIIVPDVEKFPGHIACDPRSRSEIVIPLKNRDGEVIGVLDVDSRQVDHFDETDAGELEKILGLI